MFRAFFAVYLVSLSLSRHSNSFWYAIHLDPSYHPGVIFTPTKLFMPITEKKIINTVKPHLNVLYIYIGAHILSFFANALRIFPLALWTSSKHFFIWPFWFPFVCICFWFLGLRKWECKSIFVREFYSSFPIKCIQPNAIEPHTIFQHGHWARLIIAWPKYGML